MRKLLLPLCFWLLTTACGEAAKDAEPGTADNKEAIKPMDNAEPELERWALPAPGTEVAAYEKPLKDDLNDFKFFIRIYTNEQTEQNGEFSVAYGYGAVEAQKTKRFPLWYGDRVVKPEIRAVDSLEYGAVIGFDPGDGTFRDLYLVRFVNDLLRFKQIKYYQVTRTVQAK